MAHTRPRSNFTRQLIEFVKSTQTEHDLVDLVKRRLTDAALAAAGGGQQAPVDGHPTPPAVPVPAFEPQWVDPATHSEPYRSEAGNRARAAVADARQEEGRLEGEHKSLEDDDAADFGADLAFWKLKGKCFDLQVNQYNYNVCPYGRAAQDSTTLGHYSGWEGPAHAREMKFTGGQRCWNGPDRSLTLVFECGMHDALLSVEEPEKCTYRSRFASPAACDGTFAQELRLSLDASGDVGVKDEL
jgi:hypothetical protein